MRSLVCSITVLAFAALALPACASSTDDKMIDQQTISAKTLGNPWGWVFDDPWPPDCPSAGERVAIFVHEVPGVDAQAQDIRTYHLAPAERATQGPVTPDTVEPQGVTVQWAGCGAGTVVRTTTAADGERLCEVRPDDPDLVRR